MITFIFKHLTEKSFNFITLISFFLKEFELFEKLPEKLLQAAKAREEHPVSPLSELAEMMVPPITKPAMNNRLKRLVQLAKEAKEAKV